MDAFIALVIVCIIFFGSLIAGYYIEGGDPKSVPRLSLACLCTASILCSIIIAIWPTALQGIGINVYGPKPVVLVWFITCAIGTGCAYLVLRKWAK